MPWKGEADPYRIWLSEIILQQTRVEQGLKYYNKFIQSFPLIHDLAKAKDEKVFKLWEGLGYYTRCRNLIATARYISTELKGKFPDSYGTILSLKGIGPYTAAAISSFAYNLPHAVVDGNVFRVLARFFDISIPIDTTEGKKIFTVLANELIDKNQPGAFNQAIMDFGATICKPVAPLCNICILKKNCQAYLLNKVSLLPVKDKRNLIRKRWFYYLILEYNGKIAVRKRTEKDIWKDLYEFPLIEQSRETTVKKILAQAKTNSWLSEREEFSISQKFRQQLSHQLIMGQFVWVRLQQKPPIKNDWNWVSRDKADNHAYPQIIRQYLQSKSANGFFSHSRKL